MKKVLLIIGLCFIYQISFGQTDTLSVKWEELTAPDFVKAVEKSDKVCILPLGIMEKHGAQLPLGTDLIVVRDLVVTAAEQNYAVVFPEFYVGHIDVARPQPGTVAYSPELVWMMLEETCNEIRRNGFDKIIFVNGHGGNIALMRYFAQTRMHKELDYSLYCFNFFSIEDSVTLKKIEELTKDMPPNAPGGHGGAHETSEVMVIRPDLVKLETANDQSGENLDRISNLTKVQPGISWYASFPNHYSGDAAFASIEYGEAIHKIHVKTIVKAIEEVKADKNVPALQEQFYKEAKQPLTKKPVK